MRNFKRFFHGEQAAQFQTFSSERGNSDGETTVGVWNTEMAAKLVKANLHGLNVSLVINRIDGSRRCKEAVSAVHAVWVDIDEPTEKMSRDDLFATLLSLRVQPHLIVESSPGRFHVYWRVSDCTVAQFRVVQKALAMRFGGDANICDLVRAMRIPGSLNHKYTPPYLVNVVHIDEDAQPVTLIELTKRLKLELDVEASDAKPVNDKANSSQSETVGDNDRIARKLSSASEQPKADSSPTRSDVKAALKRISSDYYREWFRVGAALHSWNDGERSFVLWDRWSKTTARNNYDEASQRRVWDGFKDLVGGVNIATVFFMAKQSSDTKNAATASEPSESSLAEQFAVTHSGELRYNPEERTWYHFNGVVWRRDEQAPLMRVREMIDGLYATTPDEQKKNLARFRTRAQYAAIAQHAQLFPVMLVSDRDFDLAPNLLAVKNGVIDLDTGAFRAAQPTDWLRRQMNAEFDAAAKCPTWIAFLKSITQDDLPFARYLQRSIGYTLYGHAREQVFFVPYGTGANGKGTFMRVTKDIAGDYGISVKPSLLTNAYGDNPNAPSPAIARLHGARHVICTETKEDRGLDKAFVKQFAGGDELVGRATYGEEFSFKPEGKLWLSTNQLMEIDANDEPMWRRLRLLPFAASFLKQNDDKQLEEKLLKERSGVLNWMLKGARLYASEGLGGCPAVERAEATHRLRMDSVAAWLKACCEEAPTDEDGLVDATVTHKYTTQAGIAHESYKAYCDGHLRAALSAAKFRAQLVAKGFVATRRSKHNLFVGFRLREGKA
jgi:putative DNA primase/helicase